MALRIKVLAVQNNHVQITDGTKTLVVDRKQLDNQIKAGKVEVDSLRVKCLDKQRDTNNKITAYLIADKTGKQMAIEPYRLKDAMYNYQVICVNLTLTSDGRLVDTSEIEESTKITFEQALEKVRLANKLLDNGAINFLLNVASNLGYTIGGYWVHYNNKEDKLHYYTEQIHEELHDNTEANIYYITKNEKEHYIIIPDNVTKIKYKRDIWSDPINIVNKLIKNLKGTLTIVGGKNIHANYMLTGIKAVRIDLKYFVPDSTEKECNTHASLFEEDIYNNIALMFKGCKSKIINANEFVSKEMEKELKRREKERKEQEERYKKSKMLYLLVIADNNDNIIDNINNNNIENYIFFVKDMNWNTQKCTFDKLRNMILKGYKSLNFRLTADNNSIEYKTPFCNTQYALIDKNFPNFEVIDKQSGKIVDEDIIYNKPVDCVEVQNGELQTLIPQSLSNYAVNPNIDYDIMMFINHLILEFSDHPDKAESAMYALINAMEYKQGGGSAGDDVQGLYNQYKSIADKLSVEDLKAIVSNHSRVICISQEHKMNTEYEDNKYRILEAEFIEFQNKYYEDRSTVPDEYYDKLLKLAGLPSWAKTKVKNDLYMLNQ